MLVGRGCVVARWHGYSLTAPNLDGSKALHVPATYINATHLSCRLSAVTTAGNTTVALNTTATTKCKGWPICGGPHRFSCDAPQQGGYHCAFVEHFALFAPAFGRRPYIAETHGSIVVDTDYSLQSAQQLTVTADLGHGVTVKQQVRAGARGKVVFRLDALPSTMSADVAITLTLPGYVHKQSISCL